MFCCRRGIFHLSNLSEHAIDLEPLRRDSSTFQFLLQQQQGIECRRTRCENTHDHTLSSGTRARARPPAPCSPVLPCSFSGVCCKNGSKSVLPCAPGATNQLRLALSARRTQVYLVTSIHSLYRDGITLVRPLLLDRSCCCNSAGLCRSCVSVDATAFVCFRFAIVAIAA